MTEVIVDRPRDLGGMLRTDTLLGLDGARFFLRCEFPTKFCLLTAQQQQTPRKHSRDGHWQRDRDPNQDIGHASYSPGLSFCIHPAVRGYFAMRGGAGRPCRRAFTSFYREM